jgi:hypothetical protein
MIVAGSIVRHILKHPEHDRHHGLVTKLITTHVLGGATTHEVIVRWITPDGSPSDGTTCHVLGELELVTP